MCVSIENMDANTAKLICEYVSLRDSLVNAISMVRAHLDEHLPANRRLEFVNLEAEMVQKLREMEAAMEHKLRSMREE